MGEGQDFPVALHRFFIVTGFERDVLVTLKYLKSINIFTQKPSAKQLHIRFWTPNEANFLNLTCAKRERKVISWNQRKKYACLLYIQKVQGVNCSIILRIGRCLLSQTPNSSRITI